MQGTIVICASPVDMPTFVRDADYFMSLPNEEGLIKLRDDTIGSELLLCAER